MEKHKEKIIVWPDGSWEWLDLYERQEDGSDDYMIIEVDARLLDKRVDSIALAAANGELK